TAAVTYRCQTASWLAEYSTRIASVHSPATVSLTMITRFRLQRSTSDPATSDVSSDDTPVNTPINASEVAFPVCSHIQMVMAKRVMPVPTIDTSWPNQTIRNRRIPAVANVCITHVLFCCRG